MRALGQEYPLFVAVIVALFFGLALFNLVQSVVYVMSSGSAQGKILEFKYSPGGSGGDTYNPKIEFQPATGDPVIFLSNHTESSGRKDSGDLGQTVTVYYDPDNPTDAEFAKFSSLWRTPIVMFVLGLLVLLYLLWCKYSPED